MKTYAIVYNIRTPKGFMEEVREDYHFKTNALKKYIDILETPYAAVDISALKFIEYNEGEIGKDITKKINKFLSE